MLDLTLIMILAALWQAPTVTTQADYEIRGNGFESELTCKGHLYLDNHPGKEAVHFRHSCVYPEQYQTGSTPKTTEMILRYYSKQLVYLNPEQKRYFIDWPRESANSLNETVQMSMNEIFRGNQKVEQRPFLEGSTLWIHPSTSDFWMMRVQEPQQKLFTDIELFAQGFSSHLYLNYSSAALPAEAFKIPAGYTEVKSLSEL
ncbi:MAG TPA: hypothetical protein V6D23_03535 [Candidatus Obscuribacterales bacterium]